MYGWSRDSKSIFFLRNDRGFISLWHYDLHTGATQPVEALQNYTALSQIALSHHTDAIALIASGSRTPPRVITYTPESMPLPATLSPDLSAPGMQVIVEESSAGLRTIRRSSTESLLPDQLSEAQTITWQGHDGDMVHGLYYPPVSAQYAGVGLPPLIVHIHGGPTSQVTARYNDSAQFFTSRGFAMLEVNYRGSTGYGRTYMLKLRASWGIYDVEDAASGAQYLVDQEMADPYKLVIMGGSAGGFTVYQSLIEKPGFYKAGVCAFGVADQFRLVMDTHKFEAHYSDSLLGALPMAAETYRQRSPVFHVAKIADPIIVFQGEIDQVVPKNQSDSIVASLRARGVPHEYHIYEGEGHGWRKPETIEAYYTAVFKFLQQYVLFA
jgi:dipeptidyl aminopeptidase/acylaminoacyl peptidase